MDLGSETRNLTQLDPRNTSTHSIPQSISLFKQSTVHNTSRHPQCVTSHHHMSRLSNQTHQIVISTSSSFYM